MFERTSLLLPQFRDWRLTKPSNHSLLRTPQTLQSSIKVTPWTLRESQPASTSTLSFPLVQDDIKVIPSGLSSSQSGHWNQPDRTLRGFSLQSYSHEGDRHDSRDPTPLGQENRNPSSHCQMDGLRIMGPLKLRFHWSFHSLSLYILPSLTFGMNTGSWFNSCRSQTCTWE